MSFLNWLADNWFSNRGKALTLYKRGMSKANDQNHVGAIADYTEAIDMPETRADLKGMALFNRALAYAATGDDAKARDDIDLVLAMNGASAIVKTEAKRMQVRIERRCSNKSN